MRQLLRHTPSRCQRRALTCTAAGQRQQRGRLFSGIGWGGSEVLQQTLQQAAALQWSSQLLRYQSDLDRIDDMAPWHGAA